MSSLPWKAWFAAIAHEHEQEVSTLLNEYNIGGYIIGLETTEDSHKETNGEHMHFVAQISNQDYHNLSERLKRKYKLRGKALKDKPRQFGCVTKIENLEKLKAYTLKDGKFKSNLTEKELKQLIDISYRKESVHTLWDKLVAHLDKVHCAPSDIYVNNKYSCYINDLRRSVIEFHVQNYTQKGLSRSAVESAARKYIMYHSKIDEPTKVELVYAEFFSF